MSEKNDLIEYIKEDVEKLDQRVSHGFQELNTKLDVMAGKYVTKEDIKERNDWFQKRIDELQRDKLEKSEFEPIRSALSKLNWLVITAVVVAVLAFIGLS